MVSLHSQKLLRACMHAKLLHLCPTACNPVRHSPPGTSVQGILQARIPEWVAVPSSRGVFPTQGWNQGLLRRLRWQAGGSVLAGEFSTAGQPGKSRGFSLFEETLLLSEAQDWNVEQCTKVAAAVQSAIQCCRVI